MEQCIYITMAPNSWGMADTVIKSLKNCRKQYGTGMKDFDIYRAHPDSGVNDIGRISYPRGPEGKELENAPVLIRRVRKGKELPLA